MTDNPYAAPEANALVEHVPPLFTPTQVFVAAFLGGPIAGTVLLALNARTLGRDDAWQPIAAGIGILVLLMGVSFVLPDSFPSIVLPLATSFGLRAWATSLRTTSYPAGATEAQSGSNGVVAAVIVANLVALLAVMFAFVLIATA